MRRAFARRNSLTCTIFDGKNFDFGAGVGTRPQEYAEFQAKRGPFIPIPGGRLERIIRTKKLSVTADYSAEVFSGHAAGLGGARSTVHVPMLRGNTLVGAIVIYRTEVRPFTDKQIALVQSFAAQAVIAIENTRLINELRQSLEQQTATADVLRVISSSPGDLKLVFQAMLENAVRICDARFGLLTSYEGDSVFRTVAMYNLPPAWAQRIAELRHGFRAHPQSAHGRVATTKQFVQVQDYTEGPAYKERDPTAVETAELGGVRYRHGADAQRRRIGRYNQHLPSRGSSLHRQADRAAAELRRPSCYRYREHAAVK